jgi:opacity protein-like surface antigen
VGANLHLQLSKETEILAEVARSTSLVNTNSFNNNTSSAFAGRSGEFTGQAARIELRHNGAALRGRVFAARSDESFSNPSSGLAGGKAEFGVSGAWKVNERATLNAEVTRSDDRILNTRSEAASVGVDLKVSDRLTVGAGVRRVSQDAATLTSQSPVACSNGTVSTGSGYNSGYGINQQGNQQIDPVTGQLVVCTPSALATAVVTAPDPLDRTSVYGRVGYKVTDAVMLSGELQREIGDGSTTLYKLGADWQVAPKTRLYGRLEHARAWGGAYGLGVGDAATSFAFGIDTQYMQDGSLFSEYRVRDAANGRELQSAIGLRNGWRLAEGLRLSTNLERLASSTGNANAAGVGLEYTASELWKGSGRLEWRQDANNENWLMTLGLARKLDRDWTLLARDYVNRVSPRTATGGDRFQNRFQLGFAYRPVDNNKFDALGMFERKIDTDRVGKTDAHTDIFSLRANYHPSRPWWVSGRYAYKQVQELLLGSINDSYRAQLIGGRVTYDITNRWSLGALVTVLQGQGGARQHAYGLEVGYVVMDNLLVTLGYNWRGFRDDDLTGSDYTNRGWVLGVRYKFDEDLFRRNDPNANKTLVPAAPQAKP